jgi:hypothetical protein
MTDDDQVVARIAPGRAGALKWKERSLCASTRSGSLKGIRSSNRLRFAQQA